MLRYRISDIAAPILSTYLGIDLGTSGLKAVLVDEQQQLLAEASRPLATCRRHALWSEQDPDGWWQAAYEVLDAFKAEHSARLADVTAIGLSGQMHAPVCLDAAGRVLRPAILWNDGRALAEASDLARRFPRLAAIAGVVPMAGLTAPKLMWLARHEPDVFKATRKVLLPKDYLRWRLTGEEATDMSDASGTWWLDVAGRAWSPDLMSATGMTPDRLPRLVEGNAAAGEIRPEVARRFGLSRRVLVAGGAGDVAAAAVGLGAIKPGDSFLSLGTSAQLFVAAASHRPAPETLVHAFAHALPARWFQMGALLNGASCLAFAAKLFGAEPAALLREAEAALERPSDVVFLPYLTGERTPHNDPNAKGVFFGLTPSTDRADLVIAVLEGVAFAFADALAAVERAGTRIAHPAFVGGGAQSALWARIIASVIERPISRMRAADKGPAYGAARLARLAATGEPPEDVCIAPPILDTIAPDGTLAARYAEKIARFRRLYVALKDEFSAAREPASPGTFAA